MNLKEKINKGIQLEELPPLSVESRLLSAFSTFASRVCIYVLQIKLLLHLDRKHFKLKAFSSLLSLQLVKEESPM